MDLFLKKLDGMSQDNQLIFIKDTLRELYKKDLFLFARDCLNNPDINERTHREVVSALESESKRKLVVMPRNTLKSTLAVVSYSIWRLLTDPNLRILIDSEVYTNSKNFLREIKGHMVSPKMRALFGDFYNPDNWNESEITIRQRTRLKREASVTAGGVGTVKVGQHYDLIVGDDYNSDKSLTPESLEKVIRHYRMNISILDPNGTYVIIGTRYAERDLIGFVLKNEIEMEVPNESLQRRDFREVPEAKGLLGPSV